MWEENIFSSVIIYRTAEHLQVSLEMFKFEIQYQFPRQKVDQGVTRKMFRCLSYIYSHCGI